MMGEECGPDLRDLKEAKNMMCAYTPTVRGYRLVQVK